MVVRIRKDLSHWIADDSELVPRDYLYEKELSTPHQLARLMNDATADRNLVLQHTDKVAFSVTTTPDDHPIPPACARHPLAAGWTVTMRELTDIRLCK